MSWAILGILVLGLGLWLAASLARRAELGRMARSVAAREQALRQGSAAAQLQHPVIDLSRCLGCATCVAVCPEDGVLDVVHGQAMVVNGARCVGVAACARECPAGAITVTLGDLSKRDDVPVIDTNLEAAGVPGLFLAGEVTAHALIKTAVDHGVAVAREVARRTDESGSVDDPWDLCVVGAGPAGLACALEAQRLGLRCLVIEKELELGGTVARYPRRKLVMTQPIEMPMVGRLRRSTYTKEELMDTWTAIVAEHRPSIAHGQVFTGVERQRDGCLAVRTESDVFVARHVCLAIGRRGVPRKLGVQGEELPKVAYGLMEASSYRGRRILVVGGGDSAVETALGLSEQPGNQVTLSYRKQSFFRIRARNEERLHERVADGRIRLLLESEVEEITPDTVRLRTAERGAETLDNDEVFVMVGGVPPFDLLRGAGITFDHASTPVEREERSGTGLVRVLAVTLALTVSVVGWVLWHGDYYGLAAEHRPTHAKHSLLRPGMGLGLAFGIAAVLLILVNLAYLLRRGKVLGIRFGTLRGWMTSHVATGVLALLCTLVHAAMRPGDTPGGHAFWALLVLLLTGAAGRYLYAIVPRAANGRELELTEIRAEIDALAAQWNSTGDSHGFGMFARDQVKTAIDQRQWHSSFLGRLLGMCGVQVQLSRLLERLRGEAHRRGIADEQLGATVALARRAFANATAAAHFEDLRAVLGTWRYLHRWVAALMVLLVVVHAVHALTYGSVLSRGVG
ncbi:MAG: NAD(P)-binding domain-containing protein [Planctomycetes bacterium]|nr:NAD(P)-binding domain-containing protein [Planctomycetota bacterium]MCB9868803.1 NAD(P)-binding domain-containing protein [Planctomycetota bacterium]